MSRKGAVVNREEFERMKDEYYELRQWNVATGLQTRAKLEDFGAKGYRLLDFFRILNISLPHLIWISITLRAKFLEEVAEMVRNLVCEIRDDI